MVYMLLGTGFEETEAIAPLDLLRRAGVSVATVGLNGKMIYGSHGIGVEADLEIGEIYDARMEKITDWHGVTVRDFSFDNLAETQSVPILEQERFPGRIIKTPNGETVVDFGQNLAGYTELRVTAKAGQKITLWHGETLDENGNLTNEYIDANGILSVSAIDKATGNLVALNLDAPCVLNIAYAKVPILGEVNNAKVGIQVITEYTVAY
mgnify:CR=1 FL=1